MRALVIRVGLIGLWLGVGAAPAWADATGFIGLTTVPTARLAVGVAVGGGLPVIGYEVEYTHSAEDPDKAAPSLTTFMGNLLVQPAVHIHGMQFYGTLGFGIYGESFGNGRGDTDTGTNAGGGAKITLAGPLRLRLDYRVFFLRGSATYPTPRRIYAGLNLVF